MRGVFFVLLIIVPFAGSFAQQNHEPGVILLQVRLPEVVSFSNGRVINGSPQLQVVFQQYPAIRSRKLSHVNSETDGCYRIEFPLTLPLATIRTALSACPDIKIVTLNHYGILAGIPDDPLWTDQWALQKIKMPNAWDITKPSSTILVGILDTGLDYTHVDLVDNIWANPNEIAGNGVDDDGNGKIDDIRGWDFVDDDNNPQESFLDHGTRVAGVIAARTYNGIGLAGIAGGWQSQVGVRLIGLRIAEDASGGRWIEDRAKEAIDYLTWLRQQYGYNVIANMSIQTSGILDEPMPFFQASVNAARDAGVIMIAAAGNVVNDPKSPYKQPAVLVLPIPARYSGVLAIGASQDGATLQDERRSDYSLYEGEGKLLAVAPVDKTPSLNVVTTYPGNQYYWIFNGTSAACPIVVGVVALMLTINPALTYQQISNILGGTAEKIGNYTYDLIGRTDEVGYGRINAYQALLLTHAYSNKSMSSTATAANNGRRLVRDSSGKYHLVFESGITSGGNVLSEIYYRNSTDGTNWSTPVRLSAGNEQNRYSSIAARGNDLYAIWQRKNGSTHDIYFHKSTDGGSSWSTSNRQTIATNVGSADPLPVIASPATNELMAVYRSGNNLAWKRSTDNGSTWPTTGSLTGTALNSPSLAPGKTPWDVAAPILAYATNVIPNASNLLIHYYYNSWSQQYNLSSDLPGNLTQHANPSITGSGDFTTSLPHTAWDAYDSQYSGRVILHKHGWGSSSYYEFHYQTEDRPSITGLAGITAEMIFRRGSNNFFTGHYNGSYWDVPLNAPQGKYPTFSLGGTQAKYVITSGSAAPYEVKVSTSTFSKASVLAENIVRRAVGLVNPASGEWLNLRVENFLVKHKDGSSSYVDFSTAPPDTAIFSSTEAWAALSSTDFVLPADAESLIVVYSVAGDKAASLSDGQAPLTLQFKAEALGGESSAKEFQSLSFASDDAFSQSNLRMRVETEGLTAGARLVFKADVSHQRTDEKVVASLGHIYHFTDGKESASLKPLASHTSSFPEGYVLEQNYPNPFNPETEIRYGIPKNTRVAIRIYNVSGQLVATLFDGDQVAGNHAVRWNGLNNTGERVSTGVYFYKLETAEFVETRKLIFTR